VTGGNPMKEMAVKSALRIMQGAGVIPSTSEILMSEEEAEDLLLTAEEFVRMVRTGNPETSNDRARRFYDQFIGD
jgi:hypothetical protein